MTAALVIAVKVQAPICILAAALHIRSDNRLAGFHITRDAAERIRMPDIQHLSLRKYFAGIAVGLLALLVGTMVYLMDRPPEAVPFFSRWSLAHLTPGVFGSFGQSLPAFAHVFAFSILTAACLGFRQRSTMCACVAWCLIDLAFEAGQHASVAPVIAELVSTTFDGMPVLVDASGYFTNGTFDLMDVASIVAGAIIAYSVALRLARRTSNDH